MNHLATTVDEKATKVYLLVPWRVGCTSYLKLPKFRVNGAKTTQSVSRMNPVCYIDLFTHSSVRKRPKLIEKKTFYVDVAFLVTQFRTSRKHHVSKW